MRTKSAAAFTHARHGEARFARDMVGVGGQTLRAPMVDPAYGISRSQLN